MRIGYVFTVLHPTYRGQPQPSPFAVPDAAAAAPAAFAHGFVRPAASLSAASVGYFEIFGGRRLLPPPKTIRSCDLNALAAAPDEA